MKSKTLIGIFILQALLLFGYLNISKSLTARTNGPKIIFDEISHDFGKITQGTVLEYSFKFKNEGSEKLVITSVNASCGCTGAVLEGKKEFEKDESGEIRVTFNTQGRMGINSKTVAIYSNDSTSSSVTLTIKCDIYKNE